VIPALLPYTAALRVGVVVVACAALFGAGWHTKGRLAEAELAKVKAAHAQAYANAIEAARARESAIAAKAEEIVNAARQVDFELRAARAAADAAGVGLRDAAARYAARRCPTAVAPLGGSPGAMPVGVHDADRLLRVLGELDARAGELADSADRSRAAGAACERIYDAVRAGQN